MNEPAQSASRPKIKLPTSVKAALVVFLLASSLVVGLFPEIGNAAFSKEPSFGFLFAAGLVVTGFNCAFFWYLNSLRLGFGRTALVLAAGYNAVIALIKLVLSPIGLYQSNQNQAFDAQIFNPNSSIYYVFIAVIVLLLYVTVFGLLYRHFKSLAAKKLSLEDHKKHLPTFRLSVGLLMLTVVVLATIGGGFMILPLIVVSPTLQYLGYILGAIGIPLILALAVAVFLAYGSFKAVEKEAVATKNIALLASFFWIGLSLIILYHILWVVLMLTLIQIWPFQTYTPK
jgi:hypothetical protein